MPNLLDVMLQSGADFLNSLPDWCFVVLIIVLVIFLIMFCWSIGGEDDV